MNKNAIQKYAIWARNELREQVTQKAYQYEITPDKKPKKGLDSVNGRMLSKNEKKQRDELVDLVYKKDFDQMVEEVAYTWFNRLIALRFMEVNDYIPNHIRILSSPSNEFKPDIITNAMDLDEEHLEGDNEILFEKKVIFQLVDEGKQDELYRYLLLCECNYLNKFLPGMFEKMGGYSELLLPNNLLKPDSVIGKLVNDIAETDWKVTEPGDEEGGQVQIIGWLYQYYNSELKDQTFANLKKNKKISKELIPSATQLFTPDWIVRYMVENSLGRLWLDGHPDKELKNTWKYYLEEIPQKTEVEEKLKEIREEYSTLRPEDLSIADIAMGSGHILVYAFDVLMKIYRSQGYRDRDAVKSILENNLYGLDIDDRAAQLAYFAIMMKAREYDRRILSRGIQPNLFAIQESNGISEEAIEYFVNGDNKLREDINTLVSEMKDAKEYGSIITVSSLDFSRIDKRLKQLETDYNLYALEARYRIKAILNPAKILSHKMWIYCANPPYMSFNSYDKKLSEYIKDKFPNSKSDLFAVFVEKLKTTVKDNGIFSLIVQPSLVSLTSFETLRKNLLQGTEILSILHMGRGNFGIDFGSLALSMRKSLSTDYITQYFKLYNRNFQFIKSEHIRDLYLISKKHNRFRYLFDEYNTDNSPDDVDNPAGNQLRFLANQSKYLNVPGNPLSLNISDSLLEDFKYGIPIKEIAPGKVGLQTGDNNRFTRLWFELDANNINMCCHSRDEALKSGKKWFPYNKGGEYRKWFGNDEYVVNWQSDGYEIRNFKGEDGKPKSFLRNSETYFHKCISWSKISSGNISFRYKPDGFIYDVAGTSLFCEDDSDLMYLLGFLNSSAAMDILSSISPTLNYEVGQVNALPILIDNDKKDMVVSLVNKLIKLGKMSWDRNETSWNFTRHIMMSANEKSLESIFKHQVVRVLNEEINNKETNTYMLDDIFSNIYKIPSRHIDSFNLISESNLEVRREYVVSLLSYIIGTLFGRFSLKKDGLILTNGLIKKDDYQVIYPDSDNIIPIGETEFFKDDLTSTILQWIKDVYGEYYYEDNISFIAESLDKNANKTNEQIIRSYLFNNFYEDHCRTYKKRPIYWLFDAGRKNSFKCLIYMHRYQPDTIARIRTDYIHPCQNYYRSQIKHLEETIGEAPKSQQTKLKKQLKDFKDKDKELATYEEKIHHLADRMISIDLDDGVKHNYALFQDVLAKIK